MITALVRVEHGAGALGVTLGALVPGVVEGLIGEAVVLATDKDPAVVQIADALGATLLVIGADDDPWLRGAALARRDWLLCLDDGDVPSDDWVRAVERFVRATVPNRRFGRIPRRSSSWREEFAARWLRLLGGRPVQSGDLVHRALLESGPPKTSPVRIPALIERDPVFR